MNVTLDTPMLSELKRLAEHATVGHCDEAQRATNQAYIAAADPGTVLALVRQLDAIIAERDALTAHLKRLQEAYSETTQWEDVHDVFNTAPAVSLNHVVDNSQAAFLDDMALLTEQHSIQWTPNTLRKEAKRLRQLNADSEEAL